jgi:hypothetical protein
MSHPMAEMSHTGAEMRDWLLLLCMIAMCDMIEIRLASSCGLCWGLCMPV